jgi:hypothetical protein
MKIGGVPVTKPQDEILVLPRGEANLVFRAKALPDMEEFNALCPVPEPPGKLTKDGWVKDPDEPGYKEILANYTRQRLAYMVVKSLEPSDIEWTTVQPDNPKTWSRWDKEMLDAGLTQVEVNRILQLVIEANSLSEEKIKAARESFLRGQAAALAKSSGLHTEQANTQSGAPATASA